MKPLLQCPLSESYVVFKKMRPFGLRQVREIEDHITSSSRSCHHPPLKDLVCYKGTTPLTMACKYGDLEAVKRIIQFWQADIQATGVYYKNEISGRIASASPRSSQQAVCTWILSATWWGKERMLKPRRYRKRIPSLMVWLLFMELSSHRILNHNPQDFRRS